MEMWPFLCFAAAGFWFVRERLSTPLPKIWCFLHPKVLIFFSLWLLPVEQTLGAFCRVAWQIWLRTHCTDLRSKVQTATCLANWVWPCWCRAKRARRNGFYVLTEGITDGAEDENVNGSWTTRAMCSIGNSLQMRLDPPKFGKKQWFLALIAGINPSARIITLSAVHLLQQDPLQIKAAFQ